MDLCTLYFYANQLNLKIVFAYVRLQKRVDMTYYSRRLLIVLTQDIKTRAVVGQRARLYAAYSLKHYFIILHLSNIKSYILYM